MSCSRLDYYRVPVIFEKKSCTIADRRQNWEAFGYIRTRKADGLFAVKLGASQVRNQTIFINTSQDSKGNDDLNSTMPGRVVDTLWQKCLAHVNPSIMIEMIRSGSYRMNHLDREHEQNCSTYRQRKTERSPCEVHLLRHAGNSIVQGDMCCSMLTTTYGGRKYFLTLTAT